MKTIQITTIATRLLIIVALALVDCAMPARMFAETETNATYAKIIQAEASNDTQTIISCLPDIEKLWPQQPETYFKSVREAAKALIGAVRHTETKQSLLQLWTNVFQKELPIDEQQATGCLELKSATICLYLNLEEFNGDKSRWMDIANFIGEIRSRIITNYVNQSMNISALGLPPEEMEPLLKANQRHLVSDQLQQELRTKNWQFSFHLLSNTPSSVGENAKFIDAVSVSARLTKEEVKKLQSKGKAD